MFIEEVPNVNAHPHVSKEAVAARKGLLFRITVGVVY